MALLGEGVEVFFTKFEGGVENGFPGLKGIKTQDRPSTAGGRAQGGVDIDRGTKVSFIGLY